MSHLRRRLIAVAATALAVAAAPVPAATAAVVPSDDAIDAPWLGDTAADGSPIALTTTATFSASASFDNDPAGTAADFGYEPGEFALPDVDRASCVASENGTAVRHTAARTGWVRFRPGLAGRYAVSVASGYDAIILTRQRPYAPAGVAIAGLGGADNCQDARGAGGESLIGERLADPAAVVYAQIGVSCPRPVSNASCASAVGGPATVTITFIPDDADTDGVPDTLDACPAQAGPAGGCTDGDADGVADRLDACASAAGDGPDGCPSTDRDRDAFHVGGVPADCRDDDPAVRPGAAEVVNNGKDDDCDGTQATDADGDGSLAGADCDDASALRTPGRPEQPGNAIDEDCDGIAAPWPVVEAIDVRLGYASSRAGTRNQLRVKGAQPGLRLELRCSGAGCPRPRSVVVRRRGTVTLDQLASRRLKAGVRLELWARRDGHVGRVFRFTMRHLAAPKRTDRCILPGATTSQKTC